MAGTAANVRIWNDADVYVHFESAGAAVVPVDQDTAFDSTWNLVGLLDGSDGFSPEDNVDETEHFAWGAGLIRTTRKNWTHTMGFTALEENEVVNRLRHPASTGALVSTPVIERVRVAFETRDGSEVKRMITAGQAEIQPAGRTINEDDLSSTEFSVRIYPADDGGIWIVQPAMDYLADA